MPEPSACAKLLFSVNCDTSVFNSLYSHPVYFGAGDAWSQGVRHLVAYRLRCLVDSPLLIGGDSQDGKARVIHCVHSDKGSGIHTDDGSPS